MSVDELLWIINHPTELWSVTCHMKLHRVSCYATFWIINHPDVDSNLKKPFMRYFLWVYMKTAGSAVESGAGDLPHDPCASLSVSVFLSLFFSRPYLSNSRAIGMVVVRLSVRPYVRLSRMYCGRVLGCWKNFLYE